MLASIHMEEMNKKKFYDGIREFCVAERVDEEYLRAYMKQRGKKYKHATIKIIIDTFHIR